MPDVTLAMPKSPKEVKQAEFTEKTKWEIDKFGRMLFEQTGECIFIISMDLRYLAANSQALSLLDYDEGELIGMPVSDVISIGELADQEAILNDEANIYERTLKRKDGRLIPVEIGTSLVTDEQGNPAYIQSIVRDISGRKAAEKSLARNGRILTVISEATARLFRSPNIDSRISEMLESLGHALDVFCCVIFEIEHFSGYPQLNIRYSWLDASSVQFDFKAAMSPYLPSLLSAPEVVFSQNQAGQTEDIPEYSFLAIPVQGALGPRGFLGMFDRKNGLSWVLPEFEAIQTATNLIGASLQRIQYEETIRTNEFRNRTIIDALPDLLIRIDSAGLILDYTASPNHPLFIHRDMISGKKLVETWPEEIVLQILGEENRGSFSKAHLWEGFQLPFSSSIYESRLEPINPREALIIIRDITDVIRLNEMKSDFINRASHELRTPLTAAILMTDLIEQGGTEEEQKEYWGILRKELNRQKILIDRLLMAGRLESGMLKLESSPLDLIAVLQEAMQAVKPIVDKKRIQLILNTPEERLQILGDNGALEQVFINLINNAAKFSPEGKSITINIGHSPEFVDVAIIDQGMGIGPDAIPHLFEKFYRAKNVTAAEIPGSGIGLYIVKSIVEELGGRIDVDSKLNQGTTLIVHLLPAPA